MVPALSDLFDPAQPAVPYGPTVADEVNAVARGDKAIAMYSFPRSAIDQDAVYLALVDEASKVGLTLTVGNAQGAAPPEEVEVFIHRDTEAWRVPALVATSRILGRHPWTDGLEALQGALLGYSDEQVTRWIAYQRARGARWQRPTVFVLLTPEQRDRVVEHGSRSFPERLPGGVLTWFVSRDRLPMWRDAARSCAPAHAIARFAMSWAGWRELFGDQARRSSTDVLTVEVPAAHAASYNRTLESAIELLSDDGWR